jgi:hypothetical protein
LLTDKQAHNVTQVNKQKNKQKGKIITELRCEKATKEYGRLFNFDVIVEASEFQSTRGL